MQTTVGELSIGFLNIGFLFYRPSIYTTLLDNYGTGESLRMS